MKEKYIKSPLNFTGGKYKLLPQIIPLLPDDIRVFVDLFGGGFNVGVNVNCKKVIYNDSYSQIVDLIKHFYENNYETYLSLFFTFGSLLTRTCGANNHGS